MKITAISREWFNDFLSLSLATRIAVGALLGALGGSSVLGFLAEYATYNYALANGFRVPAEGVPYLSVLVALLSLGVMLASLFCFGVLLFLIRVLIRTALAHTIKRRELIDFTSMPLTRYLLLVVAGAFASTQLILTFYMLLPNELKLAFNDGISYLLVGVAVVIALFIRKPEWIKWFLTAFYFSFLFIVLAGMFRADIYGEFLRYIRYGGGFSINMQIRCGAENTCKTDPSGLLLLRTRDYLVIKRDKGEIIDEIPLSEIASYSYKSLPKP